ncbi:MAG: hypothetical protein J0G94_02110 [Sphingomonadales bacterium]|nr:hypothetical protein [Sphingomonadales bacterium]
MGQVQNAEGAKTQAVATPRADGAAGAVQGEGAGQEIRAPRLVGEDMRGTQELHGAAGAAGGNGAMNEFLARASQWTATVETYLRGHWREAGLIAAMVIACVLLFWVLGKRSRQVEPEELLLEVEAAPEEFEAALQEAAPQEEPMPLVGAPLPSPTGRPLMPAPTDDVLLLKDVAPPVTRNFATLRDAIEAMKAEEAGLVSLSNPLRV